MIVAFGREMRLFLVRCVTDDETSGVVFQEGNPPPMGFGLFPFFQGILRYFRYFRQVSAMSRLRLESGAWRGVTKRRHSVVVWGPQTGKRNLGRFEV